MVNPMLLMLPMLLKKKEEPKQPITINVYYGQPPPHPGAGPSVHSPTEPQPPPETSTFDKVKEVGQKVVGNPEPKGSRAKYTHERKHPPGAFKKPFYTVPISHVETGKDYPEGTKAITARWKDPEGHDKAWGVQSILIPKGVNT